MKILKIIGIGLLAIIGLLLIISFFLPSSMHVERSTVISAPTEVVFEQVNTLKKWDQWSPWIKMDSSMKVTYSGPESGKDASYSWIGDPKKTGSGTLTISESKPNELIVTDLGFPEERTGTGGFKFENSDGGVNVLWYMDMELGTNPMMKYMGVMMKSVMENVFDQGLSDLKKIAESMPPPSKTPEMKIEATITTDQHYLSIRDTANMSNISQKMGAAYGMIGEEMKKQGLEMAGPSFAIYYSEPPEFIMDIAASVNKPGKAAGNIKPGMLKAGNAVVAHYYGDYKNMGVAYGSLQKWISENNKKISGSPWEVYITGPMMEKDTARWQTDIYFPVE